MALTRTARTRLTGTTLAISALVLSLLQVAPWRAAADSSHPAEPAASIGCARDRVLVTAHRGTGPGTRSIDGAAYSENTLRAFELALRSGADGVEADYWPTRDGRIATHHDATLDRMTRAGGALAEHTWRQVSRVRLPGGDRVPSFGEVAALAAPYAAHRQQEIKQGSAFTDDQLARMVEADLALAGPERVLYTSSEPQTLARIDAVDPRVRVGLIARDPEHRPVLTRQPAWLDVVLLDLSAADAAYVDRAGAAGLEVSVRGVDTVDDLHRAVEMGVTRVLTDRPEVVGRAC